MHALHLQKSSEEEQPLGTEYFKFWGHSEYK